MKASRGFHTLDPDTRRAMASLGGHAVHENGTAYRWTSEKAKAAGRKGGLTRARNRLARLAHAPVEVR